MGRIQQWFNWRKVKQTNTEIEFKDLPFSQKTRILLKRKSSINLTFFKKYFTIHAKVLPLRRFRMKVVLIGSLEGMGTKTQHTHTQKEQHKKRRQVVKKAQIHKIWHHPTGRCCSVREVTVPRSVHKNSLI